jgi:hypothetical protein
VRNTDEPTQMPPIIRYLSHHLWLASASCPQKSPAEVALMRRSAQIAAAGLTQCMRLSRPGILEHQLAATFEFECELWHAVNLPLLMVTAGAEMQVASEAACKGVSKGSSLS